ncbi:MAG TPA: hypothetical protein VHG89_12395 [Verrucomicrobiae bacterium]|nr:hypothetical protein [Verrucomicrobiae bacterium]
MKAPIPPKILLTIAVMPLLAGCVEREMDYDQSPPAAAGAVAAESQPENPPPPRIEAVPISPGPGYVWIGGAWEWRGYWAWVSGRWAYPPHPGAVWVNGAWVRNGQENVWIMGHWR